MKHHHLPYFLGIFLFILYSNFSYGQDEAFITVWKTDAISMFQNPSGPVSDDDQIVIFTEGDYTYDWVELDEDGNPTTTTGSGNGGGEEIISFPQPGIYQLTMTPTENNGLTRIYNEIFQTDPYKLIEIKQWGNTPWSSFEKAFFYSENLQVSATDLPDLSNVQSMKKTFEGSSLSEVPNMNDWDVSQVEDMNQLFAAAKNFNEDIGNWDVSAVTDMAGMFQSAQNFNKDIANWNVSSVQYMQMLFNGAYNFNQPIGNWEVGQVVNMMGMFGTTSNFNQEIGSWDVSNVEDMSFMFAQALEFNQNIESWNISNVTSMFSMFDGAETFNQPIENWDTSSVVDMSRMFAEAVNFNHPIGSWDVSNVTTMEQMFHFASSFNQDIGKWNTENVQIMGGMFDQAVDFNQPIGNWNTGNVTNMYSMFKNAESFNQAIGNWDVSSVKKFTEIFEDALNFDQNLGNWNLNSLLRIDGIPNDFSFANSGMSCENYSLTLQGWADNPETPIYRKLDASGLSYSSEIDDAYQFLLDNDWEISGDTQGECSLSVSDRNFHAFSFYPNPAHETLFLEAKMPIENLKIFNLLGQTVIDKPPEANTIQLDVSTLQSGVYLLQITIDGKTENFKVIKKQWL